MIIDSHAILIGCDYTNTKLQAFPFATMPLLPTELLGTIKPNGRGYICWQVSKHKTCDVQFCYGTISSAMTTKLPPKAKSLVKIQPDKIMYSNGQLAS